MANKAAESKGKGKRPRRQQTTGASLGGFIYYIVVCTAALVGLTAYSAGASIEGSLLRTVIVLLICTTLGYAINVALSVTQAQRAAALAAAPALQAPVQIPRPREIELQATLLDPAASATATAAEAVAHQPE